MARQEIRDGMIWVIEDEGEWCLGLVSNVTPPKTIEAQLVELQGQNLVLMDALATTFEELLTLRGIVEGGTTSS